MGKRLGRSVIAYLDTNVVVWLVQNKLDRISGRARDVLEHADLLISPMVLFELEYLYEIKRIRLPSRDVLLKVEHEIGVRVCDRSSFPLRRWQSWRSGPATRSTGQSWPKPKSTGLPLSSQLMAIGRNYRRTVW